MTVEAGNYVEAMVDLSNALNEWRAGGDNLVLVGAIQKFIFAINDQQRAAIAEATFRKRAESADKSDGSSEDSAR